VLSGSTRIEEVAEYVYQPTRVLGSVADLVEELASGKPSSRLDSPAFSPALSARLRPGIRHQTDAEHMDKPRPRAPMANH
jgi:NagD protein